MCIRDRVILPLVGKEIPVVCDTYVDREFGTGVVKVTPAHDPNDFEVGVRHGLPVVKVLTDDAHMTQDLSLIHISDRTSILLEGVSFHSLSFSVPPAQPVVSLQ